MSWQLQNSAGDWLEAPFKPPTEGAAAGKKGEFSFSGLPCTIEFSSATEGVVTSKGKTYQVRLVDGTAAPERRKSAVCGVSSVLPRKVEAPAIDTSDFGTCDDLQATLFLLQSPGGVSVGVTNYGATITHLFLPDKNGVVDDCVLGFDDVAGYRRSDNPYFGAIVGRVANRICKGKFSVDGKDYTVACNNGENHLHGGKVGFDKVLWDAKEEVGPESVSVTLSYVSKDGEEGYPGECSTTVVYTLNSEGCLSVDMKSNVDQPCPVNLANHSYFNLGGHGSGDVLGHRLQLMASRFTPTDGGSIPTGELAPVEGGAFDFLKEVSDPCSAIGSRIAEVREIPGSGGGYDHNFCLDVGEADANGMKRCATVVEPNSGRYMELFCNTPGVQFYSGNYLGPSKFGGGEENPPVPGKGNAQYSLHNGFCLETQHYPDSINQENFPSILLKPGETYDHRMLFKFGVDDV